MNSAYVASPTIQVVAVCYQLRPETVIVRLRALANRNGRIIRGVVVSNHPSHHLPPRDADFEFIKGTNVHFDFSGYFEGLERLHAVNPDAVVGNVLFVNDSLFLKHASATIFGQLLSLDSLLADIALPAMGGRYDPYRSICLRNPWSGHGGYMTTFCFSLNRPAQPVLLQLLSDAGNDGVLVESPLLDAAWGSQMDPILREQIRAHLIYAGSPYLWRRPVPADEGLLRKKACCVYFEHRLSGAIGSDGVLLPINAGPRSRFKILLAEYAARLPRAVGMTSR